MGDDDLTLLQRLAANPTCHVTPNVRRQVIALLKSEHVTFGPYGWVTTTKGLAELERRGGHPQPRERF